MNNNNNLQKTCDYHNINIKESIFDIATNTLEAKDADTGEIFTVLYDNNLEKQLCKIAGIKYKTDTTYLGYLDPALWKKVLDVLYDKLSDGIIKLLISNESQHRDRFVKGLVEDKCNPLTNEEFLNTVRLQFTGMERLEESQVLYDPKSTRSAIYYSYDRPNSKKNPCGFVVINDELKNSEFKVWIYGESTRINIPKLGYFTSSRYNKTSENPTDALKIMLLNAFEHNKDILEGDDIDQGEKPFYPRAYARLDLVNMFKYSYREFKDYQSRMRKLYTLSGYEQDDPEFESMLEIFSNLNDFPTKYKEVKENYIWRITAFSDYTFKDIITELSESPGVACDISELLDLYDYYGDLIMKPRDLERVAKK